MYDEIVKWLSQGTNRAIVIGVLFFLLLLALAVSYLPSLLAETDGQSDTSRELVMNIFWTCLVIIVGYILIVMVQRALLFRTTHLDVRHRIRSTVTWVGVILLMGLVALIWTRRIRDPSVVVGLVGAGLGLSLRETLLCMAGWVLIVARKPLDIGDRVQIGERMGDVIDIGLFHTSLLEVGEWVMADQSTGRMLIVPNSEVFRQHIINYTKGFPFIWNEFSAVVTFESDWRAAKDIMLGQAQAEAEKIEAEVGRQIQTMQRRYAIHYGHLRPIVYTSVADNGVRLTLRYLTRARERRTTEHAVAEAVLDAFIAHRRVDFAYPTTRFYRHTEEGKRALQRHRPPTAERPAGPQPPPAAGPTEHA